MPKVITFSIKFPANHPRKGEPTFFVEKIWQGVNLLPANPDPRLEEQLKNHDTKFYDPKWHTIRGGNRWKVGDWFSPRIWSGKPYQSRQIHFALPIQIKKIWNFELRIEQDGGGDIQLLYINNKEFLWYEGGYNDDTLKRMCRNDGLSEGDFMDWFLIHPKLKADGFSGQILCWDESIEY